MKPVAHLPNRHVVDFTTEEPWRLFRIMAEFVESFEQMSRVGPAVTVFGSARTRVDDPDYAKAELVGRLLVQNGYAAISGGGPGIMEAVNKGAAEAKGISVGLDIELPQEQKPNAFINRMHMFRYFFIRKVCFVKYASGFVLFPGGFGTMDEFFETATLIETGKIPHFPVALMGSEYWGGLFEWMKHQLLDKGRVSAEDLKLFRIFDDPTEAVNFIVQVDKARVSAQGAS